MSLVEIFSIIIIHFIADFIMQDERWAVGKSKNRGALLSHTFIYSILWYIPILLLLKYNYNLNHELIYIRSLKFVIITFVCHTITDYFTSKIVSKKFAEGKYGSAIPNFGAFTIIGLDQCLHMIQLFTTYYFLVK